MNSLVVFLSVLSLSAASVVPVPAVLNYGAVVGASAVSHQSRVDVKSTPEVITTEVVQPVARTVVAQPAIVAAPAYSAPIAYTAPLAYSAPVAVAPAAVSHQSRVDIKTTPAVVSTYATAPVYRAIVPEAGLAYTATIGYPSIINAGVFGPGAIAGHGPVAIAGPGPVAIAGQLGIQAENPIENPELPVAPSETPEVVAARAAHLEAKAEIEEAHKIQKRSASLLVSQPIITSYAAPITKYAATPIIYQGAHISPFPSSVFRYY